MEHKAGELALFSAGELLPDDAPAIPTTGVTDGFGLRPDHEHELDFEPGDDGGDYFKPKLLADLTGLLDDEDRSRAPDPTVSADDLEYPWNRGLEKLDFPRNRGHLGG